MRKSNMGNTGNKIDVFLIDPNQFFRQGLLVALSRQQDIEIVGETAFEEDTLKIIRSLSPRVVLIGTTQSIVYDLQLIRRIAQDVPGAAIVVLSANSDDDEFIRIVAAGASAFSSKDIGAVELANIIRRVGEGELLITESLISKPTILARVLKHFQDLLVKGKAVEAHSSPITAREAEILTHVACGYSNKQIASIFKISEQTIKNHMASILRKMTASDRTHAAVMAMQYGWISTSPEKEQTSWTLSENRCS